MQQAWMEMTVRLLVATLAGAIIGLERSYHGRPAGFRTHALVCLASGLLMLVTLHQGEWFGEGAAARVSVDPTRMAQGVMTGIGFLGAGVIMQSGLTIHGLTTAASIWTTAAIGILAGVGLYPAVVLATLLTLGILAVFRHIERAIPAQMFATQTLHFRRGETLSEQQVRAVLDANGFTMNTVSYRLREGGSQVEYRMVIQTRHKRNFEKLAQALLALDAVVAFAIDHTDG